MKYIRLWVALGALLWLVSCTSGAGAGLAGILNKLPIPAVNASTVRGPAPLLVNFTSVGSRDPDGTITLYEWDFNYTGNQTEFVVRATGPVTSNTYFQPGLYFVALRVTDNRGMSAIDFLRMDVAAGVNQPPSTDAKASLTLGGPYIDGPLGARVGEPVFFQGNGFDPDGGFVTPFWDFDEVLNNQRQTTTFQNPIYIFQTAGNHFVRFRMTDNENTFSEDFITITVTTAAGNDPPNAFAEVSIDGVNYSQGPLNVPRNFPLYFRAQQLPALCNAPPYQNCDVKDGPNVQFRWNFGDSSESTQQNTTHTFGVTGNRTVILTVTDTENNPGTDTVTINVYDPQPPTADAKASKTGVLYEDWPSTNPLAGSSPLTVYFRGIGGDPRGLPLSYFWNFGDGATSTEQNPTHTYVRAPNQNRFTANLTVTNSDGLSGSDPDPPVVRASAPPVPSITANPSSGDIRIDPQTRQPIPLEVDFDAGASFDPDNPNAANPPRGIVSFKWDFCFDGTFGTTNAVECPTQGITCNGSPVVEVIDPSQGGPNTATPCFAYARVGSHVAAVLVTDADGDTAIGTTIITATGNQPPVAVITTTPSPPNCAAPPCLIRFDGSTSSDADGTIISYEWDFDYDGTNFTVDATGTPTSNIYTVRAFFTAALRVTDDQGGQNIATVIVNVGNVTPVPPVVTSITPIEVFADLSTGATSVTVPFDSVSCDPDNVGNGPCPNTPPVAHPGITAFNWDFGDGSTATTATPTHTYDLSCVANRCPGNPNFLAANFHVTLTVTDDEGNQSTPFVQDVVISPFLPFPTLCQFCDARDYDFTVRNEADTSNFRLVADGGVGTNVITMQFCLLSADGQTSGAMPIPCILNDGEFNTVYAKKTGGNPLYANYQQYFVSEDGFSGGQVAQWRQTHPAQTAYPILIDVVASGNRLTALDTWISPPLGTGNYNISPPPLGNGLPVIALIDFNGFIRWWGQAVQGGQISGGIIIPGTTTTASWEDVVDGFLRTYAAP